MWNRVQEHRHYDDVRNTIEHYGRTVIFSLGVIKAIELVTKKHLL